MRNPLPFLFAVVMMALHVRSIAAAGQILPIGRQAAAGSQAVVISNEDSAQVAAILAQLQASLAVTQSGAWNIGNITGTITLPAGASTSANQSAEITSLTSIATSTALLGSGITISLPAGASTAANQSTEITSLASIATNTALLGSGVTVSESGTFLVGGDVAAGSADSGNPVKMGGVYNSPIVTLAQGERGNVQLDQNGNLKSDIVGLMPGGGILSGVGYPSAWDNGNATNAFYSLVVSAIQVAQTGTYTTNVVRTPNIFKAITLTSAGQTPAWTPASGKRFRLMGYSVEATNNCAASSAGIENVTFYDGVGSLIGAKAGWYNPATAATTFGPGYQTGARQLGNGYLSVTANNVLLVDPSVTLTAGEIIVNVWGTEE